MDYKEAFWLALIATAGFVAKYFFDKFNKTSENSERIANRRAEDGDYKTVRDCTHSRGNCKTGMDLQLQLLTDKVDDCHAGIQTIKNVLFVVASKAKIDPIELKDLVQ